MKRRLLLSFVIAYDTALEEEPVSLRSYGRKVSTRISHIE
jgi:hypothetical protein